MVKKIMVDDEQHKGSDKKMRICRDDVINIYGNNEQHQFHQNIIETAHVMISQKIIDYFLWLPNMFQVTTLELKMFMGLYL
jgi:hypothetical protein